MTSPPELNLVETRVAEVVAALARAEQNATDWHDVGSALKLNNTAPAEEQALAVAFDYMMAEGGIDEGIAGFGSMWTMNGRSYPMPADQLPEEVWDLWLLVLPRVTDAISRSRLADLLFSAGRAPKHEHALTAATAYLEVGSGQWIDLYRAEALTRGLDIARKMGQHELGARIASRMIALAGTSIAGEAHAPGVSLRLIQRLIDDKLDHPEIEQLLTDALLAYGGDAFIVDEVRQLQRRRATTNEARASLDAHRVDHWLVVAERESGIRKHSFLQKALEAATTASLPDLVAEATQQLQAMTVDDLGLQEFSGQVSLSGEVVQQFVETYAGQPDLESCLMAYGLFSPSGPPSGTLAENKLGAEQQRKEAPLTSMIRRQKVGGDGLPRWKPQTDEEHEDDLLTQQATMRIMLHAPLLAMALDEIGKRYTPQRARLETFFASNVQLPPNTQAMLVDGLMRFWADDATGCVYVVVPQVEAMLRSLARGLNPDSPLSS